MTILFAAKKDRKRIRTEPRAPVALSLPPSFRNGNRAGGKEKEQTSGLVAQPGGYLMSVCSRYQRQAPALLAFVGFVAYT